MNVETSLDIEDEKTVGLAVRDLFIKQTILKQLNDNIKFYEVELKELPEDPVEFASKVLVREEEQEKPVKVKEKKSNKENPVFATIVKDLNSKDPEMFYIDLYKALAEEWKDAVTLKYKSKKDSSSTFMFFSKDSVSSDSCSLLVKFITSKKEES